MDGWTLDYDGRLRLRMPPEAGEAVRAGSFYKLSLRRYMEGYADGVFSGRASLTYLDFKRVLELCRRECGRRGVPFTAAPALEAYIAGRENRLEIRARLGLEIKNQDPKLQGRFQAYRGAVDRAMVRPLRERQMWDSFFLCWMRRAANFSVPGAGKTAAALGMYAYLKGAGKVKRMIVVCPKSAFGSWIDEFSASFGEREPLRLLNLHGPRYGTAAARRAALRYDGGRANLILVNYELAGSLLEDLIPLAKSQAMLIFDEVHKVKRVNGEYAAAALSLARAAGYVTAMTGTPIPNTYLDLYNLLHILFPDEYEEFFGFSIPVLRDPTPLEREQINRKLQPFFCRTTKEQLAVPAANPDALLACPASERENRLLRLLEMRYRRNRLPLFLRILQLETDPKLLLQKLDLGEFRWLLDDQVPAGEIDFADYSQEVRQLILDSPPSTKFLRCVEQVLSLTRRGRTAVVWCIFLDSIRSLAAALEARGVCVRCIYGAVPLEERQQILTAFRSGQVQVLITNPHTLAESVSLHSVCHDAVYYEYSYNLVHLLQSKDRIHRLGLPPGQYTQYTYLQVEYWTENGPWSMEGQVYRRLREKEQTMRSAIDRQVLEVQPTSQEDLEVIFGDLRP